MPEAAELAPVQTGAAARLDDLMLAMDVVDTLRHHEDLVARELDQARRDDLLIDRLRSLYRSQGIQVTDRVLQEGVRALKEQRFVYTPPPPGVRTRLALLWVNRGFLMRRLLRLIIVAAIAWLAYQLLIVQAAEHREEQRLGPKQGVRVGMDERLPVAMPQVHADGLGTGGGRVLRLWAHSD